MSKSDRNVRFLTVSMIAICLFCIAVFTFLTLYLRGQTEKTVSNAGSVFMASMNDRISKHFSTMLDTRITQLDKLVEAIPDEHYDNEQDLRNWLIYNAKIRGFLSLAYYFEDGSHEMLYGDRVKLLSDSFLPSLADGGRNICVGVNDAGEQFAIVGVPFPLEGDDSSNPRVALLGRLPIEYISDTLSLDEENSLVYSFVVKADGSFVIRSFDAYRDNYFDRVRAIYSDTFSLSVEGYLEELQAAMREGRDYSRMVIVDGDRRHMYCSKLPSSEWYLITFMPYGPLNETVEEMGRQSLAVTLGSCLLILAVLFAVFRRYFRMSHAQMRELEAAKLAAEEASRSKGEFLSNMSHDIRTPMNAIVGMTSIALANVDNPKRVQDCLKKIVLSSKHLLGLINDVLDMSKIESGKMILNVELVSLREVMDGIVSIVQPQIRAKNQRFNIFIYDICSENVLCDSVRLNQVVLNLLSNAIKFTPEGGAIDVSLHEVPSPKGEEYVRILLRVKDTGIGMSEEFQEHIFDSFTREDTKRVQKTEGTGLGMAITKYIVDAMGGEIVVNSVQGVGTEFLVTFDFARTDDQEEEMILPNFTMLVVDDDQQLCESTVASLRSIGIQAEWALNGESAVEMVKQHHKKHNDYHIILLDWKLPGMDGICTARLLRRELGDEVPILLLSAYDCSEIEEEARAAGINGFLSKPLFKSTLYYGLKPYIDSPVEVAEPEPVSQILAGKRILLAEDNDLNAEIATELLREAGLEVSWAENGQICAELFAQSEPGYYDAVLMDIRMPVKNGYEATAMIRRMDRPDAKLPIIAMTADAFSEDIQRCLDCGMNAHIAKPIDVKEIIRVLHRHLTETV